MLRWMLAHGYGDPVAIERRAQQMEAWLAHPVLGHRLGMRGRARASDVLAEIVAAVPLPPLRQH